MEEKKTTTKDVIEAIQEIMWQFPDVKGTKQGASGTVIMDVGDGTTFLIAVKQIERDEK